MDAFNHTLTRLFDWALWPFRGLDPMWAVAATAAVLGVVLVWAFGKVSNQQRIARLKDRIKGHMLEMWIFRHNAAVVLKAQGRTLGYAVLYTLDALRGMAIVMVPVLLVLVQLQARYGYAPLRPGESAVLRVLYAAPLSLEEMDVALDLPSGVVAETPALRVPDEGEVDFRISAAEAGVYDVGVTCSGERVTKSLCVGTVGAAVSPRRASGWFGRMLYPTEPGLGSGRLRAVELRYPQATLSLWGMEFHWMWAFLIISLVVGMLARGPLKVAL